jgi:hypothetical protein
MVDVIDKGYVQTRRTRPEAALSPIEAAASLAAASSGAWEIEHAIDPAGEESIIILPTSDDPALPTFMLYEEHGLARVATIRRDVWERDQAYLSGRRAVEAILAATAAFKRAA